MDSHWLELIAGGGLVLIALLRSAWRSSVKPLTPEQKIQRRQRELLRCLLQEPRGCMEYWRAKKEDSIAWERCLIEGYVQMGKHDGYDAYRITEQGRFYIAYAEVP